MDTGCVCYIKGATSNEHIIFFLIKSCHSPVKTVPFINRNNFYSQNNLLKVYTHLAQWQKSIKSADFIIKKCFALDEYKLQQDFF